MDCRVIYKPDGQVVVIHPAPKAKKPDESDQDFLDKVATKAVKGTELEGLPFDDINPATLPDRAGREKWRGSKGAGVSIDNSIVTLAERRQAKEDALDAELGKPSPNPVAALKLQRDLAKGNY